jgi:1-acyl-sn-glycerol-3-phosphate acyltransferase
LSVAAGASPGLPAVQAVPGPKRAELAWYRTARALLLAPGWLLWRPVVVGRENLPQTTPYILAPVHRSYIDTLLAGYLTSRRLRFMGKSGVFAKPWAARLFSSLGGFPVRRGMPDREALAAGQRALADGEPLVLFPEGRRGEGPVLGPLLNGPAFLALRANVPIVPLGIGGSQRSMPVGSNRVRPVKIYLVVGRPIWPPPKPATGRVPRSTVDELTARLEVSLQQVFDRARELAGDRPERPAPGGPAPA